MNIQFYRLLILSILIFALFPKTSVKRQLFNIYPSENTGSFDVDDLIQNRMYGELRVLNNRNFLEESHIKIENKRLHSDIQLLKNEIDQMNTVFDVKANQIMDEVDKINQMKQRNVVNFNTLKI